MTDPNADAAPAVPPAEGVLDVDQAQQTPVLAQNDATEIDKVAGIVVQTRADVGDKTVEEIAHVLAQRIGDASITLADDEIRELAQQIAGGAT